MLTVSILSFAQCSSEPTRNTLSRASAHPVAATSPLDAIRDAEDHRQPQPLIDPLVNSSDPVVVEAALLAAGRIGDPALVSSVTPQLNSATPRVRERAAYALELLNARSAGPLLSQQLSVEQDERAVAALARALGTLQVTTAQGAIEQLLTASPSAVIREGAARGWRLLVTTLTTPPSTTLLHALLADAIAPAHPRTAIACARALSSAASHFNGLGNGLTPQELLAAFVLTNNEDVQWFLLRALRFNPDIAIPLYRAIVADPLRLVSLRGNVLQLLTAAADLLPVLDNPSPALRATALGQLAKLNPAQADATLTAKLAQLAANDSSSWVRGQALLTLTALQPATARPLVVDAVSRPDLVVQEAAIAALGTLGSPSDVTLLFQLLTSSSVVRIRAAAANAVSNLTAAQLPPNAGAVAAQIIANAPNDPNIEPLGAALSIAATLNLGNLGPSLVDLYSHYSDDAPISQSLGFNGRISLLATFAALTDAAATPLVLNAVADPIRLVGLQAASAYKTLTGVDLSAQVRLNNLVNEPTPTAEEIDDALDQRVVISLCHGDIVLRMLSAAPVTAAKFVARVRRGFYDGLIFHRVIPGFVAQGGDPLGLGSGGDTKFVRDEVSTHSHRRGTLGIATAGKDTGNSQIFINLADNSTLDDGYTVFAEIESGIELIDRIELGDTMLSAHLQ
jgi:cyclophilin family peptidyl-prolyl cis-trans isomerase/HEAT repeat protein